MCVWVSSRDLFLGVITLKFVAYGYCSALDYII